MQMEKKISGDIIIVKALESRIDAKIAQEFKEKMIQVVDEGNKKIILNLSEVDFIDSSGLGVIISILKRLNKNSSKDDTNEFVLCGTQQAVKTILSLTRMDRIFQIFENEEKALVSLN